MEKKDLDWGNLGFNYMPCDYSYVCNFKDGAWEEGGLTADHTLTLSEDAGIFHYCQEVFEGLKAYTTASGDIVCFRPDLNAERMYDSAERLVMPPFPKDKFVEAVKLAVAKYDRAAPHGTGNIKAGLNYAMSLLAVTEAHEAGYAENMYLDSQSRTYVEETGGANILFVDKNGALVVPKSATDSILPSITRRSLVQVARDILGLEVIERPVKFDEVLAGDFVECGLCGTAAVISPVGKVEGEGVDVTFPDGVETSGPVMKKLRETLVGIQTCEAEDPFGWVVKIV